MRSLGQVATVKGFGPAHVALSPTFPVLFVSNYGSGSVVVYSTVGGPEMKGPIYFEEFKRGSGVVPGPAGGRARARRILLRGQRLRHGPRRRRHLALQGLRGLRGYEIRS